MAAEDDEIDILGDFTFDSCLSKNERTISSYSDLLQCDYTVHPQWLLDTATTACWYDNPQQDEQPLKPEVTINNSNNFSDDDTQPSTSKHTTVEWSSNERELLQKGMEVYGRDPIKLSVFLGSKSSSEIQLFIETEYGIHLEVPSINLSDQVSEGLKVRSTSLDYGEILTDNEIPASIEEVICMVSTAEPTVPEVKSQNNSKTVTQKNPRSILKKNFSPNKRNINRSLLKNSHSEIKSELFSNSTPSVKDDFRKDYLQSNNTDRYKSHNSPDLPGKVSIRKMVKTQIPFTDGEVLEIYQNKTENYKNKKYPVSPGGEKNRRRQKSNDFGVYEKSEKYDKKSKFNISLTLNKTDSLSRLVNKRRRKSINSIKRKGSKQKLEAEKAQSPQEQTTVMQIVTGSGQALPLSAGEQVIKIEKSADSDADSDIEIDVDSENDNPFKSEIVIPKREVNEPPQEIFKDSVSSPEDENFSFADKIKEDTDAKEEGDDIKQEEDEIKTLDIPDNLKEVMMSMETPVEELLIDVIKISDLEKFLYPDFFEGRPAKTPDRYKLIRSHLISSWQQCRPFYLTKTGARHGLRNCGDVNCIGRIHTLMEQIGAINFNCEQTSYIRPLSLLITRAASAAPNVLPSQPSFPKMKQVDDNFKTDISRQRKKKLIVDGDGGYTITHSEFGEFYEAISEPRQQRAVKKKPISLMYCKSFTEDYPAPYNVTIALSALILMDFHSHTCRAEVMGLLGGHYVPDKKLMSIEQYVPCDSLENSGTHCDMCPVSQSAASEELAHEGMETIGWHHSHPLFPPQPSAQDLRSQADLQAAFYPRPFLALILSPHWPPGRSASQYKCLIVKKDASSEQEMAFRFKTHLRCDIASEDDVKLLLRNVEKIWNKTQTLTGNFLVDMKNDICTNARISYLDKWVSSVQHHLMSCENKISQLCFKAIIEGIRSIVR